MRSERIVVGLGCLLLLAALPLRVCAFLPEDRAILQQDEIINAVEAKREEGGLRDVETETRQRREERNRRIAEEMAGPPVNFEHFRHPTRFAARRPVTERRDAAESPEPPPPDRPGFLSPIPSLFGIALFAGLLVVHAVLTRHREKAARKGNA